MSEENNATTETTETQQDTTFTQSEVDSRISKAVDSALKKQQAKLEEEKQQAIEDASKKAETYAKLSAKEKEDAEYKERLTKLEQRERELNMKQLKSEVESDLKNDGLPVEFASTLINLEDNEKIKESIKGIKKQFDEAVNNAVKEALRQDTPKGSSGDAKGVTKEQFNNMGYSDRATLYAENPELYKQLTN